ncbi:MAG TPA: thioredoxin family protein [Nevskiaceae bacterium]|nr:thioredoxin family protein [Nevskiaceae bacterium]
MNPIPVLGRSALLVATLLVQTAYAAPEVGKPAPAFSAVDTAGETHQLADFKGKTVVLEWTNDQCPFVKKHYDSGNMQALQAAAEAEGVVWLSLISSAPGKQGHVSPQRADELTESRKATPSAVLLDEKGTVGRLYDAKTTPHMFVIDPAGTLVYAGAIDSTPSADPADIPSSQNYVKLALAAVKEGKPVSTPVSKPYGCSIKY